MLSARAWIPSAAQTRRPRTRAGGTPAGSSANRRHAAVHEAIPRVAGLHDPARPWLAARARPSAPNDPPDNEGKGQSDRDARRTKKQQGSVEDRLRFHPGIECERLALQSIGQQLLPDENVSAPGISRAGIV